MNLSTSVSELPFVGPIYAKRLEKLEIKNIEDLLYHLPHRYLDFSLTSDIGRVQVGETLTIKGTVGFIKNQYTRSGKKIQIAEVEDNTGKITVVWFNQPFLTRTLYPGREISLAGEVGWFGRSKAMVSPEYEIVIEGKQMIHTGRIIPIYPETAGISSKWLRNRIKDAFFRVESSLAEFLNETILNKYHFVTIPQALKNVHFPENLEEANLGRERLAFNELLLLQVKSLQRKMNWRKNVVSNKIDLNKKFAEEFYHQLPFKLTNSQERTIEEIFVDLVKEYPMNRLLEGDVGSGKTVVATAAAFAAFTNGFQSIFMAPTQILAQQHYKTLTELLKPFKTRISLITSDVKNLGIGKPDIFVGTHALIHQKVDFKNVALVVIDEQHRFGVEQRTHLVKKSGRKNKIPHVLTMTATPIPRTVALTLYGDLDLSTLDEMPAGRQKISTWVVPPQKRERAYDWIEKQIKQYKTQAFIVCPLIEESEKETMQSVKAATAEYKKLQKIFKNLRLGLLHGRQSAKEKDKVLHSFREGKTNILVATAVVEVGIDIPNATIMVIEDADRFGLAELHQLRGRVGRGKEKSYCLLFSDSQSEKVITRLTAMTKTMAGAELAELDLKLRGPGEIFGTRQHGFPELKIASWGDFNLIKLAKKTAEDVFDRPAKYANLLEKLRQFSPSI
jgi:ATP-dependent DNA helicase RecG